MKMYVSWINGQYQIFGLPSYPSAQPAHNTANLGVKHSASSYNGGQSNEYKSNHNITQVPHQTAGVNNNGYQTPQVTMQNPSCNLQGGQHFPVTKPTPQCQNDTSLYRGQSYNLHYNGSTGTQAITMSTVQHNRINQGLYQVANQGLSKTGVVSTMAAPPQVRQGNGRVESSTASNISLDNAVRGLHPSNYSGPHTMTSSHLCNIASSCPPNGQILNAFATLFDDTKTNGSPAAVSLHNTNGTHLQASTEQQTTKRQSGQVLVEDSLTRKKNVPTKAFNPLLTQLLLEPGTRTQNDKSNSSREVAVVHPLTSSCNIMANASKCPTAQESLSLPIVDEQKKLQQEHSRSSFEIPNQPPFKKCQSKPMQATRHIPDTVTKDCSVTASANKFVTPEAPEKDKGDNNKGQDILPDPKPSNCELSSLPTLQWTFKELLQLLEPVGLENQSDELRNVNFRRQIMSLFWDNSLAKVFTLARTTFFSDVLRNAALFCMNLKEDTIVLSQVQPCVMSQLKNFHVLKDGEVYSEQPYSSSWLNKNELDDIDKEFGPNIYQLLSSNPPDEVPPVNVPSKITSEVPKPVSETEDESTNSDPLYSFEIKVLPPEEAKAIFEQGHGVVLQCIEKVSEPEPVPNTTVVDEPLRNLDVTSSSHMETSIQQYCCIEKWKEVVCGSKTSLDKCKCGQVCGLTKLTSETKEKIYQMDCQEIIVPDLQLHSPTESKSEEKTISSIPTISWLEICDNVSQTFDISDYNKETDEMGTLNEIQPIIRVENKATNSEKDLHNQMANNEDREETQLKSAESCQPADTDLNGGETLVLPLNGNCEQAQKASSDMTESPLEQMSSLAKTGSQTAICLNTQAKESETRKRKRPSIPKTLFPSLKKLIQKKELDSYISKSRKVSVPSTDCEPSVPGKTVQLVLFGSLPREKRAIPKRCQETPMPPEVVYAHISPFKRKPGKCASSLNYSVTKEIRNKARPSHRKMKHRKKLNAKNSILSSSTGRQKNSKRSIKDFVSQLRARHESRNNEHGTQALLPIQENVLKFSVLPNSFSFEDESMGKKETTDCCPDKSSPESKQESLNKKYIADVWSPLPGKQYNPAHHRATSKSSSVFAEFQKKYMEMSQPSITQ